MMISSTIRCWFYIFNIFLKHSIDRSTIPISSYIKNKPHKITQHDIEDMSKRSTLYKMSINYKVDASVRIQGHTLFSAPLYTVTASSVMLDLKGFFPLFFLIIIKLDFWLKSHTMLWMLMLRKILALLSMPPKQSIHDHLLSISASHPSVREEVPLIMLPTSDTWGLWWYPPMLATWDGNSLLGHPSGN